MSVFGQVRAGTNGYFSGQAEVGRLAFDDVERVFNAGPARVSQRGSTRGRLTGLALSGGYWFGRGTLRHGPVAAVSYQDVRVDAYAERGASSTTMTFGEQERQSLVTEAGWAVRGAFQAGGAAFTPLFQVAYNTEDRDQARRVGAGLVTMNGTFDMPGFTPNGEWMSVKLGTGIGIGDRAAFGLSYHGRLGDQQDDHLISAGFSLRR